MWQDVAECSARVCKFCAVEGFAIFVSAAASFFQFIYFQFLSDKRLCSKWVASTSLPVPLVILNKSLNVGNFNIQELEHWADLQKNELKSR